MFNRSNYTGAHRRGTKLGRAERHLPAGAHHRGTKMGRAKRHLTVGDDLANIVAPPRTRARQACRNAHRVGELRGDPSVFCSRGFSVCVCFLFWFFSGVPQTTKELVPPHTHTHHPQTGGIGSGKGPPTPPPFYIISIHRYLCKRTRTPRCPCVYLHHFYTDTDL